MSIPTVKKIPLRAFTLVEVVLALGVISFALVAILGVFPGAFNANRASMTETRAAQLANAVTSTIDGQCDTFSNVTLFGLSLDLAALSTGNGIKTLYVSYPSPNQPTISNTATPDSIYKIELSFNNDPFVTQQAPPVQLGPGKMNQIQIRIRPKDANNFTEYFYLARNRS